MSTIEQCRATTKRRSSRGDPGATGRLVFRVEHGWSGSTLIILGQKLFLVHSSSQVKKNPKITDKNRTSFKCLGQQREVDGRIGQFDMCYFFLTKKATCYVYISQMCRNFDDRLYKFLIYSSALCRHEYINRIVDYVLFSKIYRLTRLSETFLSFSYTVQCM